MPKGKSGIKRGGKGQSGGSIPQATTIADANALAVSLGLAKHADFGNLDVSVANEMIAQIQATKSMYPGLQELEVIGANGKVREYLGGSGKNGNAYGYFMENPRTGLIGIGINPNYYSSASIVKTRVELKDEEYNLWRPVGSGSVKGVIDHEIGHWIDHSMGLSKGGRILQLFRTYYERHETYFTLPNGTTTKGSPKMARVLSRYANKNGKEFFAEAWSEYRNNPNPRPIAKEIGDITMSSMGVKTK